VDKSSSAKKELIVKIELFVILPGLGVDRKCRHGSLPAARRAIPENICSSRAFLRLTLSGGLPKATATSMNGAERSFACQ
jgi:hypothetical protein